MGLGRSIIESLRSVTPEATFNYAKRVYHRLDDLAVRPRIVTHVFGGLPLSIHIKDRGAEAWYDHDWEQPREIQMLAGRRLRSGATVFDIGAHHAVVAMMLANVVGPTGKVLAVEANLRWSEIAEKNVALNGFENVRVLHAAIAAQSGEVKFTDSDHVGRGERGMGGTAVKAMTVDDLANEFGCPDVLFIDVEGYECEVLRGATQTLQTRPDMFVEVHVGVGLEGFGGTVADLLNYIPPGYEISVAEPEGEFRPLSKSAEVMKKRFFLIAQHPHTRTHTS